MHNLIVATLLASLFLGQVPPQRLSITLEDGDLCTDRGFIYMLCASGRTAGVPVFGYQGSATWSVEVASNPDYPAVNRYSIVQCEGVLEGEDWTQEGHPVIQAPCPLDENET